MTAKYGQKILFFFFFCRLCGEYHLHTCPLADYDSRSVLLRMVP